MTVRSKLYLIVLIALFMLSIQSCSSGDANTKKDMRGKVTDFQSGKPIGGAMVTVGSDVITTDDNGTFTLHGPGGKIGARAYGYTRGEIPFPNPSSNTLLEIRLKPFNAKALYLTYYGIGDRSLRGNALKLIEQTELNALVIDVKGDRGVITYKSAIPLASEIGAQKLVIVKDIKGLIETLKAKGVYTIARIVVFKDDILGAARPALTVKTIDGKSWRDREDLLWMDPSKKEVWQYNIDIAEEAARNGFDEIQFDYVRFPDHKGLKFAVENTEENRVNSISGFLAAARKRLAPYNVFISADVFGYVSWNLNDTQIGQRLDKIAPSVDYICLMLYPSGFQFGIPGYRNPVAHPYEIVSRTLKRAQERTGLPAVRFRPWLQAFRDYAFDKRYFYGPQIKTQIDAAESFGSDGWMLWNPRNNYIPDGLKKEPLSKNDEKQAGKQGRSG